MADNTLLWILGLAGAGLGYVWYKNDQAKKACAGTWTGGFLSGACAPLPPPPPPPPEVQKQPVVVADGEIKVPELVVVTPPVPVVPEQPAVPAAPDCATAVQRIDAVSDKVRMYADKLARDSAEARAFSTLEDVFGAWCGGMLQLTGSQHADIIATVSALERGDMQSVARLAKQHPELEIAVAQIRSAKAAAQKAEAQKSCTTVGGVWRDMGEGAWACDGAQLQRQKVKGGVMEAMAQQAARVMGYNQPVAVRAPAPVAGFGNYVRG